MNKESIIGNMLRAWQLLESKFKKQFLIILIGICVNSTLEIIGLAAILPIMAASLKQGFIQENQYLNFVYAYLGFSDEKIFILLLCGILLVVIISKNGFALLIQKVQFEYCWNIHENISSRVLLNAYRKGFSFFNSNNSNKIFNDVAGVPMQFARQTLLQILQLFNEAFVLTLIVISLLVYDGVILALLALVVLPVFFIFYSKTKKRVADINNDLNNLHPLINKPIFELAFGYVDVVIGGVINFFKSKYVSQIKEAKSLRVRLLIIQNIPNRLIEICVILAVIIIVVYGVFTVESRSSIVVLISIFGLAAYRTVPSINRLMTAVLSIKGQEYCLNILETFLSKSDHNNSETIKESQPLQFKNHICIQNLYFKFEDSDNCLIENLNLKIKKGETIGLSGKSGSGKTTLMNLLLGFLQPTSGTILIDDKELNASNIENWQKLIGYVRQDVFIIDGTLLENIAFGIPKEEIDLEKANQVIKQSQLEGVLSELPEGIHSFIGERGNKLSGGQRQRVGIARALYHGALVLFFDEATSALDSETEEEITQSIRQLQSENITMIIIAHRASTLRFCDKIYKVSKKGIIL